MFVGVRLLFLKLFINAVLILLTTFLEGVWLDTTYLCLALAAIVVAVNFILPFAILLLSIPLNTLTLAISALLANTIVLGLLGYFIPAFHLVNWHAWLIGSVLLGAANFFVSWLMYRPALHSPTPS